MNPRCICAAVAPSAFLFWSFPGLHTALLMLLLCLLLRCLPVAAPQMKALYASRRPYADWLKTNTVTIGEVVATAPSAMAPQLLGVPATSSVHPDPKTLASNTYSSASNGYALLL